MIHRLRGTLDTLIDDERRPLRPIGMSVRDAAARTAELLVRLGDAPGVRVAAGVRVTGCAPPIGFVVSTAAHVLLVESVAWPAGAYTVTPHGRVLCDGTYIGQSVHPLLGCVRRLRRSRRRLVGAVVVVHPSGGAAPSLPTGPPAGPAWISPAELQLHIAQRLQRRATYCQTDSMFPF